MKRSKRFTIRRIALGLAVAAVLAPAAEAKPTSSQQSQPSVEIPYLSGGVGVSHMDFDPASGPSGKVSSEIPYLSHGDLSTSGSSVALGPDDLSLTRPSNAGSLSVASSSGSWEVGPTTISGFALALVLLIGGSVVAIRHNRKTRLSPA